MDVFGFFLTISSVQSTPSVLLLLLLNLLFVLPTLQDTLFCGSSSYQVSLDPSRPNVFASGGRGGNAGGASSVAISNSGAKYQFVKMNVLMRNVCDLVPEQLSPDTFSSRLVITRCEECLKCPQKLADIQRTLTERSVEANLQSLLVILVKNFESARSTARLVQQDTTTKFVFIDEDDLGSPTICELTDSGDGNSLKDADSLKSFSKTSVLFVSISFIILMVISLAWLVFYYVQRFRYAHAKDRLQRRLFNAAKKALAKIPTHPVKAEDKELNSDCPVCIDPYRQGDICRQLPCRHIFHKSCVDPWLLEHRTCPMCKSDILKAFGYHVNGRRRAQFSATVEEDGPSGDHGIPRGDRLSFDANSTCSESANPFPVVTEVHDPFDFSPSASPQLIQMVQESPRGVQIVPLTVNVQQHPHQQSAYCSLVQASIERHSTEADSEDQLQQGGGGGEGQQQQQLEQSVSEREDQQHRNNAGAMGMECSQLQQHPPGSFAGVPEPSLTGLSLFRAVTGRRHHVVNLVHVRSRSFSQSQLSPAKESAYASGKTPTTMPTSNSATYGFGTEAIIYSMDRNDTGGQQKTWQMPLAVTNGGETTAVAGAAARALTAPSGFRRKTLASAENHRSGARHWWSQRVKTTPTKSPEGMGGGK